MYYTTPKRICDVALSIWFPKGATFVANTSILYTEFHGDFMPHSSSAHINLAVLCGSQKTLRRIFKAAETKASLILRKRKQKHPHPHK